MNNFMQCSIQPGMFVYFLGEYNGKYYGFNETWDLDNCTSCKCLLPRGVVCSTQTCINETCAVCIQLVFINSVTGRLGLYLILLLNQYNNILCVIGV